jgi:hypothetical protein
MKPFPDPLPARLMVARGAHRVDLAMFDLIARLALAGPLRVLDGGNCINVYPLARALRRQTSHLDAALRNVKLSRAFTCYQMLALLADTPASQQPTLVLDMLDTYYDESVPLYETRRLLEISIRELRRLCGKAPLVVSARPPGPDTPDRQPLYETLLASAQELF